MTTKREQKYVRALDDLDARRDAGKVSPNEYELQRTRLLTEAGKQPWHWGVQLLVVVGILLAALVVLRVVGALINASGT